MPGYTSKALDKYSSCSKQHTRDYDEAHKRSNTPVCADLSLCGLRHPVMFVGFQDHASLSMVTLDSSGLLCVWPYSADAFSGFGWYTPSKVKTHEYKEKNAQQNISLLLHAVQAERTGKNKKQRDILMLAGTRRLMTANKPI